MKWAWQTPRQTLPFWQKALYVQSCHFGMTGLEVYQESRILNKRFILMETSLKIDFQSWGSPQASS